MEELFTEQHGIADRQASLCQFKERLAFAGADPRQIADEAAKLNELSALGALWRDLWRAVP